MIYSHFSVCTICVHTYQMHAFLSASLSLSFSLCVCVCVCVSLSLTHMLALGGNCAVEGIAIDQHAFACAFAMGLENVDGLDWIANLTLDISSLHGYGRIHNHV